MKTIYLNGVMLDRCEVFVTQLARKFRVALPGWSAAGADPDLHLINPLAVLPPRTESEVHEHAQQVVDQTAVLADSLAADLTALDVGFEPDWRVPGDFIQENLVPRINELLTRESDFRRFHAQQPVDLVISGADYGSQARVVVLAARQLGVPTLNLEHGFFFSRFDSERVTEKSVLPTVFTSDYANLDNALEVAGFARDADRFGLTNSRFLSLGTPVETVCAACTSREEAVNSLGLDGQKKCVLLLGSWIEARAVDNLIAGQLETIAAYEDLLRSLAASGIGPEVELLIKLHPVEAHPAVLPGVKAALERIAVGLGLPVPHVHGARLAELLSAADVVVSLGFSSLMFDAFLLGKPSVVLALPFLAPSRRDDWRREMSAPLRAGVQTAVATGAEVWAEVQACFTPARQAELKAARAHLSRDFDLEFRSVATKSEAIIDWIANLLAD